MTTRSIVTSHPEVACDVCARRLLRGEQPDYFLVDGRRRIVCELCAPRATLEGWKRESDQPDLTLPPLRPRRGRGLLHRLLGREGAAAPTSLGDRSSGQRVDEGPSDLYAVEQVPYDLFGGDSEPRDEPPAVEREPAVLPRYLQEAVTVFNAGEYPQRMAGVARSLGEPVVSVRQAEHLDSIVRIVFAWELCWYRYEVDLGEGDGARASGQGTELEELGREELEGNAVAAQSGAVSLAQ